MSDTNAQKEVNITRTFNVPRDVLFNAFTNQETLARWWGPKGFTNPVCEFEAKDGSGRPSAKRNNFSFQLGIGMPF